MHIFLYKTVLLSVPLYIMEEFNKKRLSLQTAGKLRFLNEIPFHT